MAEAKVWERPIAPGLVYREEIDSQTPRMFHILRFIPGKGVTMTAELANGMVYSSDASKGRQTVTEIVAHGHAVAGLNGDFFPFTGDPVGFMMHDGKLVSLPYISPKTGGTRPALLWNDVASLITNKLNYSGSIAFGTGSPIPIDGLDQDCQINKICLDMPEVGLCLAKAPCTEIVLSLPDGDDPMRIGTVQKVLHDATSLPIPEHGAVLVAQGDKAGMLPPFEVGDAVTIRSEMSDLPLPAREAVGGGPILVQGGKVAVSAAEEGFDEAFSKAHHPRTAVGRRADGELWFVVVDGRQKISDGMSLNDLAQWFVDHGCKDAMNLDGGNSSTLSLFGLLTNHPSDGVQRPVANAILFHTMKDPQPDPARKIDAPESAVVGTEIKLRVRSNPSKPVARRRILWLCQGAAWIDQDGILHPTAPGLATVEAVVDGQAVTVRITCKPAPQPSGGTNRIIR